MAIKHNQKIISNHFRKDWQRRVRVHFDQAGKKASRRVARQTKAAAVAPRPLGLLRPVVRCPTIKYNRRLRAGRGFSLAELKAVGLSARYARTIGISVDPRRQNLSEESIAKNIEILQDYKKRLIVLPNSEVDISKVDIKTKNTHSTALVDTTVKEIKTSEMPAPVEGGAYRKLRLARSEARLLGKREKRARDKAEAEAAKK
ncbi:60S ribosomal protein L13 [Ceratocystis lukuohia]|uniref:60S ribosomal protein L13 n=3 Tax=Ceratocystis TaxID=5157 RepID=A0A0F8BKX6_CERFI|nr:60S ribosomal protein L13 [Ceratocystis platani]PHH52611.1 60S ribosomal protein L13 [Ceratocystis fimbriata CBS 114723]